MYKSPVVELWLRNMEKSKLDSIAEKNGYLLMDHWLKEEYDLFQDRICSKVLLEESELVHFWFEKFKIWLVAE